LGHEQKSLPIERGGVQSAWLADQAIALYMNFIHTWDERERLILEFATSTVEAQQPCTAFNR
jgi:hypothetical protein